MSARLVTECSVCNGPLVKVLSLGSSPPTCVMERVDNPQPSSTHYPLDLMFCETCTLGQLSVFVDPEVVFPVDYPYSSGHSKALHANFEDLARQAYNGANGLSPQDLVVDIGANDGTLLSKFPEHVRTVGVEPTDQATKASAIGIPTIQKPFTAKLAEYIKLGHGPAKVITACNVLAHVADIDDVMKGIRLLLADDGVLIAENHDLASVVDGQWDTVYHEHLRFFSPYSFAWLLKKYDLNMYERKYIPTHGGSFRAVAGRGRGFVPPMLDYQFAKMEADAHAQRDFIRARVVDGVYGIGATARATTLINFCGLDAEDISCVCEVSGSDKIGRLIPGTRIPVVDEARLFEDQPPVALLLSWHLADVIVPKLREKGYEGEIIVPLPELVYA